MMEKAVHTWGTWWRSQKSRAHSGAELVPEQSHLALAMRGLRSKPGNNPTSYIVVPGLNPQPKGRPQDLALGNVKVTMSGS